MLAAGRRWQYACTQLLLWCALHAACPRADSSRQGRREPSCEGPWASRGHLLLVLRWVEQEGAAGRHCS
jgi:hypothetical protein